MILKVNLDKSEDSADAEDPDDPEERGGDWEVLHQVLHQDPDDRGNHQHKIKQVPGGGEVVMSKADDFDSCL